MAKSTKRNAPAADRRREYWRKVLRRWQSSGLSQAAFCRQRKIPAGRFTWWKRRLRDDGVVAGHGFVPVQVAPWAVRSSELELTLRGGRVLRFDANVNVSKLAAIAAALEVASC
jgi:hypothetical protein